jgi:CO dehydrogenase maturation factor
VKIAISGKGGAGKTTLAGILARLFVEQGCKVFAIDADPDANLALALGFPNPFQITPLIQMKQLIEERTGAKSGTLFPYFKLNPKVDDIPDSYFTRHKGINLAVMGTVRGGGLGCTCPENAFLKALLRHLIVDREEIVILDMEAGIEHLGRGTVQAVNWLIAVVEPTRLSTTTAQRIRKLAFEIGLKNIVAVGNKIRRESDREFLIKNMPQFEFRGFLPYDEQITGEPLLDISSDSSPHQEILEEARKIAAQLVN